MKLKVVSRGNKYHVADELGRVMSDAYFTQEEAEAERQALITDSKKPVAKPLVKPRKPRKE